MTDLISLNEKLNPRQYKAIDLYSEGKSEDEICEAVGVAKSTFRGWLANNPHFKSVVRQHFSAFATVNHVFLADAYEKAVKMLVPLLEQSVSVKDKVAAIGTVHKFMKTAMDAEKPAEVEEEAHMVETTEKDGDGKILSITEQKTILRRIRGEHGSEQVLDGEGKESGDDSIGTPEVLQGVPPSVGGDTPAN